MISKGKKVKFDFSLHVDGEELDSSNKRGPVEYVHGQDRILKGLADNLEGLTSGDEKVVSLPASETYGEFDPDKIIEVDKTTLPEQMDVEEGRRFKINTKQGKPYQARIHAVKEKTVLIDTNHPLAGKTLEFRVKILDVR